jgi:hypothetical protein
MRLLKKSSENGQRGEAEDLHAHNCSDCGLSRRRAASTV